MKVIISLRSSDYHHPVIGTMVVDFAEAARAAAEKFTLFQLVVGDEEYYVAIDDLCALGHAAELRREVIRELRS